MAVNHEAALRELAPTDLCEQAIGGLDVPHGIPCPCQFCSIRRVDAGYLDGLHGDASSAVASIFSFEQAAPLDLWEQFLGLPEDPTLDEAARWARVRSARTRRNGLSKAFFEQLAIRLGYSVMIQRGVMPFRAGISRAGDPVKSVNRLTVWNPLDSNDIRNQAQVVTNPLNRGAGVTAITTSQPFPSDFWTWIVTIVDLGSNLDSNLLRERFEALKPHYSTITWMDS